MEFRGAAPLRRPPLLLFTLGVDWGPAGPLMRSVCGGAAPSCRSGETHAALPSEFQQQECFTFSSPGCTAQKMSLNPHSRTPDPDS